MQSDRPWKPVHSPCADRIRDSIAGWLQDSIGNIIFKLFFIIPIVYPILIFYSTKLLFGKFTTLNLAVSLVLSLLFFVSLVALVAYLVAWGLGQIGMNYF